MNLEEAILNELRKTKDAKKEPVPKKSHLPKKALALAAAAGIGYLAYCAYEITIDTKYKPLAVPTVILGISSMGYALRKFRDTQ